MKTRVAIVDYGIGNIFSVQRALERCGAEVHLAVEPEDIEAARLIVLPGVGAFAAGMQGLQMRGFVEPLQHYASTGKPLLGICLGMQMLASTSAEFGSHEGLGLIPGEVVPIPSESRDGKRLKVPHVGWADLRPPDHLERLDPLFGERAGGPSMYLVHSYHMRPRDSSAVLANYSYGGHAITAAVRSGNIMGFQFHPERSAESGLRLLGAYLKMQMT